MNYLLSFSALLLFALQLIAQPNLEWVRTYNGTANQSDNARDMLIDSIGNIYVTGSSQESTTGYDICTIKYNNSGNVLWIRKFNSGPGATSDGAMKIIQDRSGNIIVAGNSLSSTSLSIRYVTVLKYDEHGNEIWNKILIDSTFNWLQMWDFDVDIQDNIYITGERKVRDTLAMSISGCVTFKLNRWGNIIWNRLFMFQDNFSAFGLAIRTSNSNNVFVGGLKSFTGDYRYYIILKYDINGNLVWSRISNNLAFYSNSVILTDDFENIYVPCSENINWVFKSHLVKVSSGGDILWDRIYYGDSTNDNYINRLKFDNSYNVIAIGYDGPLFKIDYLTIKYSPQGNELWHRKYSRTANTEDWARDVDIDSVGNIYVTGGSYVSPLSNTVTIKYNNSGAAVWTAIYAPPNESSGGWRIKVMKDMRNFLVSGSSSSLSGITDYLTIKYSQPIGIQPISSEIPDRFSLSQNYPNPFNPVTKIKFDIPSVGQRHAFDVRLVVYDILGREAAVIVNQQLSPGKYQVDFDGSILPSGVYFYKITAGQFTDSKKMILVK